jgi:hypothetical protein
MTSDITPNAELRGAGLLSVFIPFLAKLSAGATARMPRRRSPDFEQAANYTGGTAIKKKQNARSSPPAEKNPIQAWTGAAKAQ